MLVIYNNNNYTKLFNLLSDYNQTLVLQDINRLQEQMHNTPLTLDELKNSSIQSHLLQQSEVFIMMLSYVLTKALEQSARFRHRDSREYYLNYLNHLIYNTVYQKTDLKASIRQELRNKVEKLFQLPINANALLR